MAAKKTAGGRFAGLHTNPIPQLEQKLAADPTRQELRLQLLRLYHDAGLTQDFVREASVYRDVERQRLENKEWDDVVRMGRDLEPFSALFASGKIVLEAWDVLGQAPDKPTRKVRRFGDDDDARAALSELDQSYAALRKDRDIRIALEQFPAGVAGRYSPLHEAKHISAALGGARIFVKREDLAPPESYLVLHIFGQVNLARMMGKKRVVSGSTSAARGALTAAAAAHFGLKATVYLDDADAERQSTGLVRLKLLGAKVKRVNVAKLRGQDIRQAALADWLQDTDDSFMVLELGAGPAPYPTIARDLTGAIGREARQQFLDSAGWLPDVVVARGQGRADPIALFPPFLEEIGIQLVCVEPGGASFLDEEPVNQYDPFKQPLDEQLRTRVQSILEAHGYPKLEREHQDLKKSGRVDYVQASPKEAAAAIAKFSSSEGIIPGMETAYPLAWAMKAAAKMPADKSLLVMFAERSDRDIWDIAKALNIRV